MFDEKHQFRNNKNQISTRQKKHFSSKYTIYSFTKTKMYSVVTLLYKHLGKYCTMFRQSFVLHNNKKL